MTAAVSDTVELVFSAEGPFDTRQQGAFSCVVELCGVVVATDEYVFDVLFVLSHEISMGALFLVHTEEAPRQDGG